MGTVIGARLPTVCPGTKETGCLRNGEDTLFAKYLRYRVVQRPFAHRSLPGQLRIMRTVGGVSIVAGGFAAPRGHCTEIAIDDALLSYFFSSNALSEFTTFTTS